jgi:hypothetical protein
MKKVLYILASAIICIGNLSIAQPDRNVIWVHGMEGSNQSWNKNYQHYTATHRITNLVAEYTSNGGVLQASNQVRNQINSQLGSGSTNPTNMAICHSMGGLTIRQMEKDDKQNNVNRIGGFVTVGTPNQGAQIANSLQQGLVNPFIQQGAADLIAGPVASGISIPFAQNFVVTKLSEWISEGLFQKFQSFGQPGATNDLKVGNSTISTLNSYNCTKPRIAIAGSETAPAFWREINSLSLSSPSSLTRGATNDNTVGSLANVAAGIYDGFYWTNRVLGWVPKPKATNNLFIFRANQWLRGKVWLERANGMWASLAGSVAGSTTVSYPFLSNKCWAWGAICVGVVQSQNFQIITPAPYDGIVTVSSALGLPGANFTNTITGVNHQECVNHPGINSQLDDIFNLTTIGGTPFFKTALR